MSSPLPVDPGRAQAHNWLVDELAKSQYQAAKPTWFDIASAAVEKWFGSLFDVKSGTPDALTWLIVLAIVVVILVIAFFLVGRPRLSRKSSVAGELFTASDDRSATELRAAAEAAFRAGDLSLAIEERFRAIARSLDERTVLSMTPGTTASGVAARAGQAFPNEKAALRSGAASFDDVRYLERAGTAEQYRMLAELDERLTAQRPLLSPEAQSLAGIGAPR